MGLFDEFSDLVSDVTEAAFDCVVSGVEGAGRAVSFVGDKVVDGVVDAATYVEANPGKAILMSAAILGSGGAALAAASTIGAVVSAAGFGVAGGTLSGAAASSAGLAALGGGSLAAGGAGMAGGTAVVTAAGATVGGTTAGVIL
jgi:hypothetical protein